MAAVARAAIFAGLAIFAHVRAHAVGTAAREGAAARTGSTRGQTRLPRHGHWLALGLENAALEIGLPERAVLTDGAILGECQIARCTGGRVRLLALEDGHQVDDADRADQALLAELLGRPGNDTRLTGINRQKLA